MLKHFYISPLISNNRAATSTRQFREWYPQYGWIFRNITLTNCSDEYERYLTGYKNHSEIDYLGGGGIYTALTQPVINCILKNTSEYLKGCMTGSQVLLGIMPTVLALLGPSHNEIALLANVGRRPLLALGLALSSPSTYFSRAFEYSDPKEIMSHHKNRREQRCPEGRGWQLLITCVEYALTAGACFNAVNNSIQVGTMSISSVMSDFDFFAALWLFLGVAVHIFSCFVLRLRLREIFCTEFFPCAAKQYDVRIVTFQETKKFLVAAWWESTFTILHVVFGTLVFSSLLFLGIKDALSIVGRYMASVALCRVILMYELAGLRERCITIDGEKVKRSLDDTF
ncbi:hypothetical protein BGZ61DRAFT_497452 [Ilyonectria robusta]|uniref:uncharacterized protein n=1 Tax=Ilyonectria robusta TaxID=1079257 RepID=UPI001E8E26F8|nr:uncharacterized protein BGZ61DRAFT_497452 [Ilyonectria robusta]KAH8672260.1 hypothetical protein BGZ61DRAFT_497452 [Ilyonectria robusta]